MTDELDYGEDAQQAVEMLQQLEQMKTWAVSRASKYQVIIDHIEDEDVEGVEGDVEEIQQAIEQIQKVANKITYA
jgi:2,3-bisphosphoglycerate-independent phosphoglycerate mutase